MFLRVIKIQGEMKPGALRHSAGSVFHLSAARKEIEVNPYGLKTWGRARPELTWPRVTALVRIATKRGVVKKLVSEFRQR